MLVPLPMSVSEWVVTYTLLIHKLPPRISDVFFRHKKAVLAVHLLDTL